MRTQARPPRPIWPWIIAALVAVIIGALVIALVVNQPPVETAIESPDPTSSTSSTPSQSATEAQPSGCIGGPALDAGMVLATQDAAPQTSNGAVEVAAAFTRWIKRGPLPSTDEAEMVATSAVSSSAPAGFQDLAASVDRAPDYPTDVEPGQTFSVSMLDAMWHLEETDADSATVTLGGQFVVDGALTTTQRWVTTWSLVWEDGAWKIAGGQNERTWDELESIGRTFTGEC